MALPQRFAGVLQARTKAPELNKLEWEALSYYIPLLCGEDASNDTPSISNTMKKKIHPFWEEDDTIQLVPKKRSFGSSATEDAIINKKDGHIITLSGTGPLTDVYVTFPQGKFTTEGAFLYAQTKSATTPMLDPQTKMSKVAYKFSDETSRKNEQNYKVNTDVMIIASLIEAKKAGIRPEISIIRFWGILNRHSPINQKDLDGLSMVAKENAARHLEKQLKAKLGEGDYTQEARRIIEDAIDYGKASLQGPNALLTHFANQRGVSPNTPSTPSISSQSPTAQQQRPAAPAQPRRP